MISILPNIMKKINDILVNLLNKIKFKFSIPYKDEFTVLVNVSIANLNELSKVILSNVNMLDKTNIDTINEIKTKNAIFKS